MVARSWSLQQDASQHSNFTLLLKPFFLYVFFSFITSTNCEEKPYEFTYFLCVFLFYNLIEFPGEAL